MTTREAARSRPSLHRLTAPVTPRGRGGAVGTVPPDTHRDHITPMTTDTTTDGGTTDD